MVYTNAPAGSIGKSGASGAYGHPGAGLISASGALTKGAKLAPEMRKQSDGLRVSRPETSRSTAGPREFVGRPFGCARGEELGRPVGLSPL